MTVDLEEGLTLDAAAGPRESPQAAGVTEAGKSSAATVTPSSTFTAVAQGHAMLDTLDSIKQLVGVSCNPDLCHVCVNLVLILEHCIPLRFAAC